MSAVDRAPARPSRWPSGRLLRSELRLIFGRRRNQAGLAVLAAIPLVIAVSVRLSDPASGQGPEFFASITDNGFFVALAALTISLPLFLPLAVATIAGDAIAGEANVGSLRYLLVAPAHRARLLLVKYAAVVIFALAGAGLVALVGLVSALALFGGGAVTLLAGLAVSLPEGLLRLLGVCLSLWAGLCALGAVGLFISTLTEQPIGATIATVIVTVASFVLGSIPQLDWLHPYLLTQWWMSFSDLLRAPVYLPDLRTGLLTAAAYVVIFWSAAWARFAGRDITS